MTILVALVGSTLVSIGLSAAAVNAVLNLVPARKSES